jgi:hypothetical protein
MATFAAIALLLDVGLRAHTCFVTPRRRADRCSHRAQGGADVVA